MHQKLSNIDIFNNSSIIYMRKPDSIIATWTNVLLVGCFMFCLISCFYEYSIFNIYYAKVINNEESNYIYIQVDEEFVSLKNRNYLEINGEISKCHLDSFSDDYYVLNSKKYWEASYECELPDDLNVNDNLIEVRVEKRKTTLFKELIRKIRKELKNARVKNWRTKNGRWWF